MADNTTLPPQIVYVDTALDLRGIGLGLYPQLGVELYVYWGA